MGKLSDLIKDVDRIKELNDARMRFLEEQWAHEKEAKRLRKVVAEHYESITLAKEGIWQTVSDLQLNRRENAPCTTEDFCAAITYWVERAHTIRKSNAIVRLDGKDIDVPDIDIRGEMPELRPCYPCTIHKEVLSVCAEIRPE